MTKPDSPIKTDISNKTLPVQYVDKAPSPISNEDIMAALQDLKKQIIFSNEDIRNELKLVGNQMNELIADNSQLRSVVEALWYSTSLSLDVDTVVFYDGLH